MGFQAKFIDPRQPTDYEMNIDAFAAEGYNAIISVGSLMGDAAALKAKPYPNLKFMNFQSGSGIPKIPLP